MLRETKLQSVLKLYNLPHKVFSLLMLTLILCYFFTFQGFAVLYCSVLYLRIICIYSNFPPAKYLSKGYNISVSQTLCSKMIRSIVELTISMRFYGQFYVKNKVSAKTSLIFYFYCGSVSRETDEKMSIFFLNFLASKVKLADGFMNETGIKLWNRQIRSGKKIETDGTRRHFFVSFAWNWSTIKIKK